MAAHAAPEILEKKQATRQYDNILEEISEKLKYYYGKNNLFIARTMRTIVFKYIEHTTATHPRCGHINPGARPRARIRRTQRDQKPCIM